MLEAQIAARIRSPETVSNFLCLPHFWRADRLLELPANPHFPPKRSDSYNGTWSFKQCPLTA